MVSREERYGDFVKWRCPRDCPFNDRLGDSTNRYCSFSEYADIIEPGRHTRTEVHDDGTVDYHVWPKCDVYKKYKDVPKVIREMKRHRRTEHLRATPAGEDVAVTGRKHPKGRKGRKQ